VVTPSELVAAAEEEVDDAADDEFDGVAKKVSKKFGDVGAASLPLSVVPVIPLRKSESDLFVVVVVFTGSWLEGCGGGVVIVVF
jgi:hypothetical protein